MSSSATPDPCWPGSPDRAASAWHTSACSSGRQRSPRGRGWKCMDECRHALPFRFAPSGLMGRPRSARPSIWARRWARTRAKGYNSPTKNTESSFRNVRKSRGMQTAANACKTYDRTANLLFVGSIPTGASKQHNDLRAPLERGPTREAGDGLRGSSPRPSILFSAPSSGRLSPRAPPAPRSR